MTGKSHKKIALATATLFAVTSSVIARDVIFEWNSVILMPILWIPSAIPGGYLSDIDKGISTAKRTFKTFLSLQLLLTTILIPILLFFIKYLFAALLLIIAQLGTLSFYLIIKKMQHRRETHSILFINLPLFIGWGFWLALEPLNKICAIGILNILIGISIGIFSHILIDEFNIRPMHILYPFEILLGQVIRMFKNDKKHSNTKFKESHKTKNSLKPAFLIPTIVKIKTSSIAEQRFINYFTTIIYIATLLINLILISRWFS